MDDSKDLGLSSLKGGVAVSWDRKDLVKSSLGMERKGSVWGTLSFGGQSAVPKGCLSRGWIFKVEFRGEDGAADVLLELVRRYLKPRQ